MSIEELVNKYSPILYLHNKEVYYPANMDWILSNSTLIDHNDGYIKKSPTNIDLYNLAKKYNFEARKDGDIVLSITKDLYTGQRPIKNVFIYAYPRFVNNKTYITYIITFPYNGEYNILNLVQVGEHPFDIEHLTVELNEINELTRVYFGFHGSKDGIWIPKEKLLYEFNSENAYGGTGETSSAFSSMEGEARSKFVGFIALNGHGIYPYEGVNLRLLGIANDYMNKGTKWIPKVQIISYEEHLFDKEKIGWIYFNGRLGGSLLKGDTSGITSLSDKGWIKDIDNTESSYYNKPILIGNTIYWLLIASKNFISLLIIYFVVYLILNITTKIKDGTMIQYPAENHFITIIILVISNLIINKTASTIIHKLAPN